MILLRNSIMISPKVQGGGKRNALFIEFKPIFQSFPRRKLALPVDLEHICCYWTLNNILKQMLGSQTSLSVKSQAQDPRIIYRTIYYAFQTNDINLLQLKLLLTNTYQSTAHCPNLQTWLCQYSKVFCFKFEALETRVIFNSKSSWWPKSETSYLQHGNIFTILIITQLQNFGNASCRLENRTFKKFNTQPVILQTLQYHFTFKMQNFEGAYTYQNQNIITSYQSQTSYFQYCVTFVCANTLQYSVSNLRLLKYTQYLQNYIQICHQSSEQGSERAQFSITVG
ncbi:Hypothetical_protein [Hexamita inflata]|uniref:Hypothetical_protein n=1 Tax=Hexamita inflata TaxID=28002 RepID=A0ABP1J683_9EUKA